LAVVTLSQDTSSTALPVRQEDRETTTAVQEAVPFLRAHAVTTKALPCFQALLCSSKSKLLATQSTTREINETI